MEERVKSIMENLFQEEINDKFSKFSTDKWDSFMHLEMLVSIETEFNMQFTPEQIGSINSYKDIVDVLKAREKL